MADYDSTANFVDIDDDCVAAAAAVAATTDAVTDAAAANDDDDASPCVEGGRGGWEMERWYYALLGDGPLK